MAEIEHVAGGGGIWRRRRLGRRGQKAVEGEKVSRSGATWWQWKHLRVDRERGGWVRVPGSPLRMGLRRTARRGEGERSVKRTMRLRSVTERPNGDGFSQPASRSILPCPTPGFCSAPFPHCLLLSCPPVLLRRSLLSRPLSSVYFASAIFFPLALALLTLASLPSLTKWGDDATRTLAVGRPAVPHGEPWRQSQAADGPKHPDGEGAAKP